VIVRRLWPEGGWAAAAMAASFALAYLLLEGWQGSLAVPWEYKRDAHFNLMIAKAVLEQGWHLENARLGAPFGQELYDFPAVAGATTHILIIKAVGIFTDNPATAVNVFFLLTFPLTGLTTYAALRLLGLGRAISVACAVVFALAPYHFFRGEIHVFLAGYYSVPLSGWIALSVLGGRPLFERRLSAATLLTAGACVLIGSAEVYYAALGLVVIGIATLLAALSPQRRRAAVGGIVAALLISGAVIANHIPNLVHQSKHGANEEVERQRSLEFLEQFSLKPVRLFLPIREHRVAPLARLTERYELKTESQLDESAGQSLGLFAAVGLVLVLLAALAPRGSLLERLPRSELTRASGSLALAAIVVAAIGGLSSGIALLTTEWLRSWNRMSIFLGFFGLIGAAALIESAGRGLARRFRPVALGALLAALVVAASLDQTSPATTPAYDESEREWRVDQAFFARVEAAFPPGAWVFQIPYAPVPEYGWYHARGFLHTRAMRWSFGAMTGRPADWQNELVMKPAELVLAGAAAAGFDALYLDRALAGAAALKGEDDLERITGSAPLLSGDRRLAVYDLRPLRRRLAAQHGAPAMLRLRQSVLDPLRVRVGPEFGPFLFLGHALLQTLGERESRIGSAQIILDNPRRSPARARFRALLRGAGGGPVRITWPDGTSEAVIPPPEGEVVARTLILPPGESVIALVTPEVPDAEAQLEIEDESLTPDIQRQFLPPDLRARD